MTKKRLGRGLDALLSDRTLQAPQSQQATMPQEGILSLALTEISPSPYQPRRDFDEESLSELAGSIKTSGLLQPIVVRERAQGGYELIAGERRFRAAKMAGLTSIPAISKSVTDEQASAFALIENVQREDLNALEEAQGFARLRDEFGLTQQEIANAVGKSRVAVANQLRLLQLGAISRGLLERGEIEMGHARALLSLEGITQDRAGHTVAKQKLSVRQAEALVRKLSRGGGGKTSRETTPKDAETRRLEQRLMDKIGAAVSIRHRSSGAGELKIKYGSLEELQGVLNQLGVGDE